MTIQWNASLKPSLLRDVTALPPKEAYQMMAKINLLPSILQWIYLAMTRAMRALLVILPAEPESPLFHGFDELAWNFTRPL